MGLKHEARPEGQYDRELSGKILYWMQYPYSAAEPELPPIIFARVKELGLGGVIDLLSQLPTLDEISRQAAMVYCAGFPLSMIQQHTELNEALLRLLDSSQSQQKEVPSAPRTSKPQARTVKAGVIERARPYRVAANDGNAAGSIAVVGRAVYSGLADELEWTEDALCVQTDPELFFPEKGGSTREAKRVCMSCDARSACLDYALANDERFGVWGGLSERERRKLKKRAT